MKENQFLMRVLAGVLFVAGALPGRAAPTEIPAAGIQFAGEGEIDVFKPGVKLFSNRNHTLDECPDSLFGKRFLRNSIDAPERWVVSTPGMLTVLTPGDVPKATSQMNALINQGFVRLQPFISFQSFGVSSINQLWVFQKQVQQGDTFRFGKWVIAVDLSEAIQVAHTPWNGNRGERLYNGIQLPEIWPPLTVDMSNHDPITPPYLEHPPEVISIDVGRQLFVDEFLIEETDLLHTYHLPEKYTNNPVLRAETPLECRPGMIGGTGRPCIWWNPGKQQFYLWYQAGTYFNGTIALATGTDGLHWLRPSLDVVPGSNQALPPGLQPDSYAIVADWDALDPQQRFKLFATEPSIYEPQYSFVSADGVHWTNQTATGSAGDRSSMFYNPFRKKWIYSIRYGQPGRGRSRQYRECDDFLAGASWTAGDIVPWLATDRLDLPEPGYKHFTNLYNFDAVAYESVMLGFFELHRGPSNQHCEKMGLPKLNEISFGYSRDGFHFDRPDRRAQIPASRKDNWERGFIESGGNICVVMRDKLYFYYSGCRGNMDGFFLPDGRVNGRTMYDPNAIGISVLRRDGFASLNAGASAGHITTRPISFSGKHLFVNVDCPQGALRAEILDESGQVIEPFTLANCTPLTADTTISPLTWKNAEDLTSIAGRPVRLRFELQRGLLYSFWVSRDRTGRSDGYVAGGGPGYTGAVDTVGMGAL